MAVGNAINEQTIGVCGFTGTAFTGTAVTNHNLIIGGSTSSTLTNVAPSATSGIPVISQGASSDPTFGTAVVAGGGTGQVTLTNHGVLIGQGTSAIAQTATGSSGQILRSGGAAADPAYSTATYPSTAGTSGNVLTSDGTNWNSTAPTGLSNLFFATGTLTNAQIKAINSTPIELIAAPGAGKVIHVLSTSFKLIYGGTNAFTGSGLAISYGSGTAVAPVGIPSGTGTVMVTAGMQATSSNYTFACLSTGTVASAVQSIAATSLENIAIFVWNASANPAGNAANNNTISWAISYLVETI